MVKSVPLSARILGYAIVGLALIILIVPLLVVAVSSLSAGNYLVFPPQGLSLRWYKAVLGSDRYLQAGISSLLIALVVTPVSAVMGTAAALALFRTEFNGRTALLSVFMSPLILPSLIFGLGLLIFASVIFGTINVCVLVAGHVMLAIPFVIRTVGSVLAQADSAHEEAARVMGADWWSRYRYVLLPQCKQGMMAGAFFAFNISFDDAVIALFVRPPGIETLPLRIYSELEFNATPTVAAVSTIMMLVSVISLVAVSRVFGLNRIR